MNLTEKDIIMFDQLHSSELGKSLADYLNRLSAHVCDSRTWSEDENKTHANKVDKVIRENLIDKLVLRHETKPPAPYQYN